MDAGVSKQSDCKATGGPTPLFFDIHAFHHPPPKRAWPQIS